MQGVAFYAEMLGFFFTVFGIPAALYCLLGAMLQRDKRTAIRVFIGVSIWLAVLLLRVHLVPGGEVRSAQYSGLAGLIQFLFCATSAALLAFSIRTLRQQSAGAR